LRSDDFKVEISGLKTDRIRDYLEIKQLQRSVIAAYNTKNQQYLKKSWIYFQKNVDQVVISWYSYFCCRERISDDHQEFEKFIVDINCLR
jgi:hypothetical protein